MNKLTTPDLIILSLYFLFLLYIGFRLVTDRQNDATKRARRFELYTIPQQLDRHYGKSASMIGSFFLFVMAVPAGYILMLAELLRFFFGWQLMVGLIIGTIISTGYVLSGGFRSIVRTDKFHFILMFGSFMMILPFAVAEYGGLQFLKSNLPATHFVWHGGNGAQYIIVWYFIALSTLIEPSFYQRCFASKDEKVAQRGIIISVMFWILFDFLTTATGLYARAILPGLTDPVSSYLDLATLILPPVLRGLFLAGLLATILSTIDDYYFIAAITLGRDIIWRLKKNAAEDQINYLTRWSLLICGILAIMIAYYAKSIIKIWKDIGSIGTPALMIPLVSSFFKNYRMQPKLVIISMIGSALISGFWVFSLHLDILQGKYLWGIEPIYPGLGFSVLMFLISRIRVRK